MVCPFREGGAAVGSDYGWSQLNGVYAMLCSAMWAWYRLGHDVMRAKAARALKDVYGYELHLNARRLPVAAARGGCRAWTWIGRRR